MNSWNISDLPSALTIVQPAFPEASSSALPSPGPLPTGPPFSWPTSRPAISIRKRRVQSWTGSSTRFVNASSRPWWQHTTRNSPGDSIAPYASSGAHSREIRTRPAAGCAGTHEPAQMADVFVIPLDASARASGRTSQRTAGVSQHSSNFQTGLAHPNVRIAGTLGGTLVRVVHSV